MVDNRYLEILYFVLKSKQLNADAWLKQAGLVLSNIQNPAFKISVFQLAKLIDMSIKYYPDDDLGLEFGKLLDIHTHGKLGQLIASSHTIDEALHFMEQFSSISSSLVKLRLLKTSTHYIFKLKLLIPFTRHKQFIVSTTFACLHRIRQYLLEKEFPACEIDLNYKPKSIVQYQKYYGDSISFDQNACEYRFPISEADIKIKSGNIIFQEIAKTACEKELNSITKKEESYGMGVKRLLLTAQPEYYNLEAAAKAFFISGRTLKRKLKSENTRFQEILEEVRKELALEYLQHQTFSLQEISIKLGYSDMSNFTRAFKRWFGVPPSRFIK